MQESTLSALGVEIEMINNIFSSVENPDLINKHKPQKKAESKIVPLSKFNPEDTIFCTLDTNPEAIIINQEIQAELKRLGLENDFDEELFEIKSPESIICEPVPEEVKIFDIKDSRRTIVFKRKQKTIPPIILDEEEVFPIHKIPQTTGFGKIKTAAR